MRNARRMSLIFGALVIFVITSSCTGFFVNQPNSISVTTAAGGSSFTASPTAQLKATASFNSGTKDVTNTTSWQSSTACATVSSTGLVTAVGTASSVTVTGTLAGVSGSITGSTTGGTTQTLTINPPSGTISQSLGTQQFTATDSSNNDVTNSATWTSSNTSALTFSTSSPGLATLVAQGTTTVSASTASSGSCASGSTSITVQ